MLRSHLRMMVKARSNVLNETIVKELFTYSQ